MTHRFPIKEIAAQAGLSTATVDRVLNDRPHVSPQTRRRVAAALAELEGQEAQLAARGRRIFVDIVVEAPTRFSREIRAATEKMLPTIGPAVLRPRFLFRERMDEAETVAILDRIARRGSQGLCLKARDLPGIRNALARIAKAGIPAVTLFTDIESPARIAYAGLDNDRAGQAAAWLMARTLQGRGGTVLATRSQRTFLGEDARRRGFAAALARARPDLRLADASGGAGLAGPTGKEIASAVSAHPDIRAVYSIGGANAAILATLDRLGCSPELFVGHDLDQENLALLGAGRIDFILHHDLVDDMRAAFLAIIAHHRLAPSLPRPRPSDPRIITPANIPAGLLPRPLPA